MSLTRRICIAGLGVLLLFSTTWAADAKDNPAKPCATKPADETKPAGPLLMCQIFLLQINSPDARLPIPLKDEAANTALQSVDTPVTVLVDQANHPMNFGVILAEKRKTDRGKTDIGNVFVDLLKYNGISYDPEHNKVNTDPKWEILSAPRFVTSPNVEAQLIIGETPPQEAIQSNGTIDDFSLPPGIRFVILPGDIVDHCLYIKNFSITHTYVTDNLDYDTLLKKP